MIIDSNKTFSTYHEAYDYVSKIRQLQKGDIIICKGIKAEIESVSFCENDIEYDEKLKCYRLWISSEFRDTNGIYRSYKSFYDGGTMNLINFKQEESK